MLTTRSLRQVFVIIVRLALATMLLWTGVLKVREPFPFIEAIVSYDILGAGAAVYMGLLMGPVECLLGCRLALGKTRAGFDCAIVLFAVFAIAQIAVLVRGISSTCGCFAGDEMVGGASLVRVLGLLSAATVARILHGRISASNGAPL